MNIEYEATFTNINKDEIRGKLKEAGAKLVRPEFTQRRVTFNLPKGHDNRNAWLRVRDEGDKITLSLKAVDGEKIENQKEICLQVDNFEEAEKLLVEIGCVKKSYQVTKREIWNLDEVEIMIDEWPFLEPLLEIEGKNEKDVKEASQKLGFDYSKAKFCAVGTLYAEKYNLPEGIINNKTPLITFDTENPFLL